MVPDQFDTTPLGLMGCWRGDSPGFCESFDFAQDMPWAVCQCLPAQNHCRDRLFRAPIHRNVDSQRLPEVCQEYLGHGNST